MIKRRLLEKPVFSLSLPRLGDPMSPPKGKLTLGGIEEIHKDVSITYNDIIDNPNYNYDGFPLQPQSWTAQLQAVRMNGKLIPVQRGDLDPKGRYLSLMDSGSQQLMFRRQEFSAIAAAFKGKTIVQAETAVYFDCSIPQLLELKYHDRWFPVDPLDLIIPSDHGMKDGKELCHAALGVWDRTFADSIIGVPFLRNVISVFDYVKFETYTVQPRLGLAGLTDAKYAMERVKWDARNDIQDYI
ncbi:hypothetical protein FANTH_6401 [Fusarium anthophilum]|uniref:Peptidase A1 domain-containing protein n=1 Tax=Fusarium anthophilum TaxID=48485 RepID=A0A8H5E4X7_9HYPO|nr:hypothetical protein FANTH_6401 [Fusarium anthophilum]